MFIKRISSLTLIAAAFVLSAGCEKQPDATASIGSGGSGSSGASAETSMLQRSAAGVDVVGETVKISSDTIVDDGTSGGSTTAQSARGAKASKEAAGTTISFQGTLDLVLDLDDVDSEGNDAFPNATGVIHLVANGSITGDEFQGDATYDVTVTYDTDATFTDPASGAQATVSAGATINFSVAVNWDKVDQENWTVTADAQASVTSLSVYVTDGSESGTIALEASRHDVATIGLDQGVFIATRSIEGFWDATFSNEEESHNVRVDIINFGRIFVTIDGTQLGPYTAWEVEALYDITLD